LVAARTDEIGQLRERARRCLRHGLDRGADDIAHHHARARALSPLETLRRGYSVLQDADGHVVSSVAGVTAGAPVAIRVTDGRIHATTTKVEADD
jgi:exodeoxyribonuclease VII large subunit